MIRKDRHFKQLEAYINTVLKQDIYKNRDVECCPVCSGKKYIKYGLYNGIQRYKCKSCGKTFSKVTNSLWSYSKKTSSQWVKFIELVIEKRSLRFCAKKLKISLVTAFYWRHKVLHGIQQDNIPEKLSGDVYISKKLIPENFKGNRNITTNIRHNIWIVGAKGNKDFMLANSISRGFWDLQSFNKRIYCNIERESYIIPYGDRYISLVAKSHNKDRIKEVKDNKKIKFFGNNLEKWLKSYYGVATKYLEEYLSLFILFNLKRIVNYIDIFRNLSLGNRFVKTKEIG